MAQCARNPGSSNGRTAAFEAVNRGSNPCPGTKTITAKAVLFLVKDRDENEEVRNRKVLLAEVGNRWVPKAKRVRIPVPEPKKPAASGDRFFIFY